QPPTCTASSFVPRAKRLRRIQLCYQYLGICPGEAPASCSLPKSTTSWCSPCRSLGRSCSRTSFVSLSGPLGGLGRRKSGSPPTVCPRDKDETPPRSHRSRRHRLLAPSEARRPGLGFRADREEVP